MMCHSSFGCACR